MQHNIETDAPASRETGLGLGLGFGLGLGLGLGLGSGSAGRSCDGTCEWKQTCTPPHGPRC